MDKYNQIISEIDAAIKELENIKRTMSQDAKNVNRDKYCPIHGSKAMFNRTKLNIRDCFRRIESNFDWRTHGCNGDYFHIIQIPKDGE